MTFIFAIRAPMASFFDEQGLRVALAVISLNLLLAPFWETVNALLRREMAFTAITICSLIAATVLVATSIGLAAVGFSFMAPVWALVASSLTQAILYCTFRRDMRIFLPSLRGWRDVLRFGAYSTCTNLTSTLNQWSPQLILGRVLDATAVGLYARSVNVIVMFDRLVTDALKPVILPAITEHARDPASLKRFYLTAIELISVLQWPFMSVTALLAEPIVALLFGPSWSAAVPLARLLAVASIAMFATCLTYPVLVAVGRVRDTLIVNLLSVPPSLLLMFAASFYGVEWVAASALVALPLQAATAWWFIGKYVDVSAMDLVRACRKSALVTLVTVLPVVAILGAQGFSSAVSLPLFVVSGLAAAGGWCLAVVITKHPIRAQVQSVIPIALIRRIACRLRRTRAPMAS